MSKSTLSKTLTLKDKLSRLTYRQAVNLLKPHGEEYLRQGGLIEIDLDENVELNEHEFHLRLPSATVSIRLSDQHRQRLVFECSCEKLRYEHMGAALALILEEKTPLGLAKAPDEPTMVADLSEEEMVALALAERQERAEKERMRAQSQQTKALWTDYLVTNSRSGKTYRVALRGWQRYESYCSCPDYRKNTLGTCKHIMHVSEKVKKRFPKSVRNRSFIQKELALHLAYGDTLELLWLLPKKLGPEVTKILGKDKEHAIHNMRKLVSSLQKLEKLEQKVIIYPDAEVYIQQHLFREHISELIDNIRRDPKKHPLRSELLNATLTPYQLDGIAFAVGAGRAILADEMGLGKTIQGIGVAELLAQQAGIKKVLVISPASLKSQWRDEIQRFCHRSVKLVVGSAEERAETYQSDRFYTLCNYEQVLRDHSAIERAHWDLIILDEGQRIKNWETKTSQTIKALKSKFALVLTGTPLENRLDDLYSIVEFIDDRRLGPDFRFYQKHRVLTEKGKVIGYRNLDELREKLSPVLLRRTRASVNQQLPKRSTEIRRIAPTQEQLDMHDGFRSTISSIIHKRYLTEMDLLRLQKALLMARMSANSTYLVDKQAPGFSSKLQELRELLTQLQQEPGRKIILFSEWTTMLDLIGPILTELNMPWVRLDGKVPQKQRQQLVKAFQSDPDCQLFLTTNAGSTGINLQAANTIINIDLPWNPALLEQRIARAYRMGQKQAVQVYILVTEDTLEENLLSTLSAKSELALAVLDPNASVESLDFSSGIEELKNRLEILLGSEPDAPLSEAASSPKVISQEKNTELAKAGGKMLLSSFQFLEKMLPKTNYNEQPTELAKAVENALRSCTQKNDDGDLQLNLVLPDQDSLKSLAKTMSLMLESAK